MMQSSRQAQYQHPMVTVPHYGSPHPPPHNSDPNSPGTGQEPFHYRMPRDGNLATYPNLGSSAEGTWSNKAGDENARPYPYN